MDIKAFIKSKSFIITASALAGVLVATALIFLLIKVLPKVTQINISVESGTNSISQTVSSDNDSSSVPVSPLKISSPAVNDLTVTEDHITFLGASDPDFPLTVNGEEVKRDASGAFALEKELKIGANYFKFSHNGFETTYTVRYRYVIIKHICFFQS